MSALTFNIDAAHGELNITRIMSPDGTMMLTLMKNLPKELGTIVKPFDGKLIVGHSETGHHHVVDADCATLRRVDEFTAYLDVKKPTELIHERSYDTHPSIALQPGIYEFRTGREFDPFEDVIRASAD